MAADLEEKSLGFLPVFFTEYLKKSEKKWAELVGNQKIAYLCLKVSTVRNPQRDNL